jgi:hypothetical protein
MLKGQMRLNTEEHPVMLAEPSHNTSTVREKMVELMFETYNVPAVFLAKNAVLSSFAMGRQTSLVVDMGHESTVGTLCDRDCSYYIGGGMHWTIRVIVLRSLAARTVRSGASRCRA